MSTNPNNYSLGTLTTYKKIEKKLNKIILIDVTNFFLFNFFKICVCAQIVCLKASA
jgi:hypothetical protein